MTRAATTRVPDPERRVLQAAEPGGFAAGELDGLPAPVRRHLTAAVAPGTPLARTARLRMRGTIRVGGWLPFRAHEVLSPRTGFVWSARAAGLISGTDRYVDGAGVADWRLAGLLPVVHADGPDVTRSAAGRAGGEAVWVPTTLLPRFGVAWAAHSDHRITARFAVGGVPIEIHLLLDAAGRAVSFSFARWGDPEGTGEWDWHPFGGDVTEHRTFGGITVPAAGRIGWFPGSPGWVKGEFFRYRITDLRLVS
jgi:hypothetical protein